MAMTTAAKATAYHNFIDGAWVPSVSGGEFENRNPAAPDDLIGTFQKSTAADVGRAIEAARRAFEHWRLVPAPRRAELLFRAAQLIAERKEALARDMTREMGKVLEEARGDVQEVIDMTYFMAGEGRRQYGQTVPSELRDKFAMSIRQALGASRVVVHARLYGPSLEALVARARALRVGDGLDPAVDVGPSVSEAQRDTVASYVEIGRKEGARLACGGHALTEGRFAKGFFH